MQYKHKTRLCIFGEQLNNFNEFLGGLFPIDRPLPFQAFLKKKARLEIRSGLFYSYTL